MRKRRNSGIWVGIFVSLVIFCTSSAGMGKIIYVDDDATGANDGTSWADAYIYLQEALADADTEEKPVEIRIAQGIYKPDHGVGITPGSRYSTFRLINGVDLKGSYAGVGEADPNERDTELYETILSGDLDANDAEITVLTNLHLDPTRADNSYHVVSSSDCNESAILDGFTITAGNAYGNSSLSRGGGMINSRSSPILINCIFSKNSAGIAGGGMSNWGDNSPTLINCIFNRNSGAGEGGGMDNIESNPILINCIFSENTAELDGGMSNMENSNPILINCIFRENSAVWDGGGMGNCESNPTLTNCIFNRNSAENGGGMRNILLSNPTLTNCTFKGNFSNGVGGGIKNDGSSPTMFNCIFSGNSANLRGGGMESNGGGTPTLINCTLTGNKTSGYGGGIFCGGSNLSLINCTLSDNWSGDIGGGIYYGIVNIAPSFNCIIWNNVPTDIHGITSISHSNIRYEIQHGYEWLGVVGNINEDPLFANPGYWADINDPNIILEPNDPNAFWINGDYHLKSQAGRWTSTSSAESDPNSESWVYDDVTSPCIDAGDPNSAVGDEPMPNGGIINMGAYGGTAEASKSYLEEEQ